jgi:Ice-binding-like
VSKLHLNDQVFFVVGSAATLGDNSDFIGNILALDQIAFDPGATDLCGRALSKTACVTFAGQNPTTGEQHEVSIGCSAVTIGGGGNGGGNGGGSGSGLGGVPQVWLNRAHSVFCSAVLSLSASCPSGYC